MSEMRATKRGNLRSLTFTRKPLGSALTHTILQKWREVKWSANYLFFGKRFKKNYWIFSQISFLFEFFWLIMENNFIQMAASFNRSAGTKSGEYGGWGMFMVLFLPKNTPTSIDVWADALSCWKIHDWYFFAASSFMPKTTIKIAWHELNNMLTSSATSPVMTFLSKSRL